MNCNYSYFQSESVLQKPFKFILIHYIPKSIKTGDFQSSQKSVGIHNADSKITLWKVFSPFQIAYRTWSKLNPLLTATPTLYINKWKNINAATAWNSPLLSDDPRWTSPLSLLSQSKWKNVNLFTVGNTIKGILCSFQSLVAVWSSFLWVGLLYTHKDADEHAKNGLCRCFFFWGRIWLEALDLKDTHNVFWWVTLNVNITFVC